MSHTRRLEHTPPRRSTEHPTVPPSVAPLQFPTREVVVEAMRAFSVNPFGFVPTAKFWRETGVLTTAVSGNEILRRCVDGGLLLPPSDLFGAPHGYLPGPAAFKHKIHHPPIRGLPALPTFEEITCNARVRALSRFAQLMIEEGVPSPQKVSDVLNIQTSTVSTFLASLAEQGFITHDGPQILPTDKMEIFIDRPGFVAQATARIQTATPEFRSAFKTRRAEAEQVFQNISDDLRALVASHPGQTTHELFCLAQKAEGLLPDGTSKAIFSRWLERLTEQFILSARRERQGPVRFVQRYFAQDTR